MLAENEPVGKDNNACADPGYVTMYAEIATTPTTIGMIPFCLIRDSFNLFYRAHERKKYALLIVRLIDLFFSSGR